MVHHSRTIKSLVVAIVMIGAAGDQAVGGITDWRVVTGATYQSGTDFDDEGKSLPVASARSIVDLSPDDFSYSEATGRSDGFQWPQSPGFQGADLSSFSRAAGFDPSYGPPDDRLSANSETSSRVLWWTNHDGVVRPGQDIEVEVTLATVGQMAASQFVDPDFQAQAWAGLGLELRGGQGGTIDFYGSAVMHADPMDGSAPPMLATEEDWSGKFQQGTPLVTDLGSLPKFEINEVDFFYFDSFIGEPFVLDFNLDTVGSADGPFETYTLADFQASYRLRALDPVTGTPVDIPFQLIPESAPDLNADGQIGCTDVDQLTAEIAAGTNNPAYDLSGDGLVNRVDLDQWLTFAGALTLPSARPFQYGDANLDGTVDGSDFIIWNTHKFTSNASWCSGDFTANGAVDGLDFIEWNNWKFAVPDSLASVPEPTSSALLWTLVLPMAAWRRSRG